VPQPDGMITARVTINPPIDDAGVAQAGRYTFKSSRPRIWTATSTPVLPRPITVLVGPATPGEIILPSTDQPGYSDGAGNSVIDFTYEVHISVQGQSPRTINLALPCGGVDGLEFDFDSSVPVPSSTGTLTPIPAEWSATTGLASAARLGAEVARDAAIAAENAAVAAADPTNLDPTVAALVPDTDTATGTAVAGLLSTKVDTGDSRLGDARTPTAHDQAASTISDSTAVGRAVLTAADAAAVRTAAGAGTSSLALGSTTGTALDAAAAATTYVGLGQTCLDLRKQAGVVGDGTTDDAAAINAAIAAAAALGVRVFANGVFKIASTVTITDNTDLGDATFNYSGTTGTAIVVGSVASSIRNKRIRLPHVMATAKTTTGWTQVAGTIGVDIVNAYSCQIEVPHVSHFETGLRIYGINGNGTSYCTITIGQLDNNKVNQLLDADSASSGWSTQNLFMGGRFSHDSGEGSNVAGTAHIKLTNLTPAPVDNCTWINPSLESPGVVEWVIDAIGGTYNQWMNPRLEFTAGNPKIRWGAGAIRNLIIGGHNLTGLVETFVSGQAFNSILGNGFSRLTASSTHGGVILDNSDNNANAALTIMQGNWAALGDVPNTAYGSRLEYNTARFKRFGDAYERARLEGQNGRLYFGQGTAAIAMYLCATGTSGISLNAANLYFATDNANSIGLIGSLRPASVHAATSVSISGISTTYGAAAPTTGAHVVGDEQKNSVPSVGAPKSWVCTVAGTPGTWVSTGNL